MNFKKVLTTGSVLLLLGTSAMATTINFDDVVGSNVDITNQYAALGVTLNAIANPFPLAGTFPAPPTVPGILGGVTTWTQGFASATSAPQVAVAAATAQTGQAGDGGILISFSFDVSSVSLVGNDLGFSDGADDESVTLTAYDALGNFLGQSFSTVNLPGVYDQTPGTISFPNMRYVAFNYTDSQFGFYAIDDLEFTPVHVGAPEPSALLLLAFGFLGLSRTTRKIRKRS
jgi:hypothetical protein